MYRILIILLTIQITFSANAQEADTTLKLPPDKLPVWTLVVPGASYFYQKEYTAGALFVTLEIGGIYLGYRYKEELKANNESPYYNFPNNLGIMALKVEKLANFKSHLENVQYRNADFRYHDISEKELYLAPFRKENILTPVTGIMAAIAGATLTANYFMGRQNDSPRLTDIDQISFADGYINRNPALAFYGPVGFSYGWGAGVVEEYQFRNWLMPLLDHKYGQRNGALLSSVAFGLIHAPNFLFKDEIDYQMMATQVLGTGLAGMFYAWDVHRRDYNIGPVVAAHAWFDAILMVGSFLINPENNYMGVSLKTSF